MSVTKKTHDGEMAVNANAILTAVFGTYESPKTPEQVATTIADLPTDQLNGLFAILSLRAIEVDKQLSAAKTALLGRIDTDIASTYGRTDATIGVTDDSGNPIGEIQFSDEKKEVLNTETDKKVPDKVKNELKRLGIGSQYIDVAERLNNTKLKEAKKAGTLPSSVSSLLSVSQKTTRGVAFKKS